ncbi:TetR/AcrR family transcriptional regulator [Plantibacter flavus]|uniref:TetR/AcrR family transcriptional regulator n=1 Tax=Plantibacter flavus TaxID=150123 RepID=UPI003F175449
MPETRSKPMRRDGAENRESLLRAAREVFATQGIDVALEEVARAAGVSRMTLYRNFSSREELAASVYEESVARIEQRAEALRDEEAGIVGLLDFVLDMQQENQIFVGALSGEGLEWLEALSERTESSFTPLLERALRSGVVHPDTQLSDVMLAFPLFAGVLDVPRRAARERQLRDARALIHRALFA